MDVQQFYIAKYDYSHHKSQQHKRYVEHILSDNSNTCVQLLSPVRSQLNAIPIYKYCAFCNNKIIVDFYCYYMNTFEHKYFFFDHSIFY